MHPVIIAMEMSAREAQIARSARPRRQSTRRRRERPGLHLRLAAPVRLVATRWRRGPAQAAPVAPAAPPARPSQPTPIPQRRPVGCAT